MDAAERAARGCPEAPIDYTMRSDDPVHPIESAAATELRDQGTTAFLDQAKEGGPIARRAYSSG